VVALTVKTLGGTVRLHELLGLIKEVGGLKKFKDLLEAISGTEADTIPFRAMHHFEKPHELDFAEGTKALRLQRQADRQRSNRHKAACEAWARGPQVRPLHRAASPPVLRIENRN
jgi:hypothetical protein